MILSFRQPDAARLDALRDACRNLPFNYTEIGCTREDAPSRADGYQLDHYRTQLGAGASVFADACRATRAWQMLQLGWVRPCWPDAPIEEGALIATRARVFGFYIINVCRIVYVEEEPERRFAFAYGTLPGHVERGEERFAIDRDSADDTVWFSIRACSRPGSLWTFLGYPLARRLQRRFGRDSLSAMASAIAAPPRFS
ncbi:hypothetical protein AYO40_04885 [Planctomycetaceae bacterium SCGC AG-212-D15]|nr:hypothetical protein AYO40_04885 [Planctomycetaceae bacterium SCGC AG-212-D15]